MDEHVDIRQPATAQQRLRALRLPSRRASALLAALTLGVGIAAGAALGPAPDVSLAGSGGEIARRLALAALLAQARESQHPRHQAQSAAASPQAVDEASTATPAPSTGKAAATTHAEEEASGGNEPAPKKTRQTGPTLPPISSVWLIELAGPGFSAALAQPTAAPFISQTVGQGTLLGSWSALSASAFASEAALSVPPAEGGAPPLLRTIVQPPCPEGAAGEACAPETPGQLTSADEFLKATLATITSTPAYEEHGLVVVTFATVAIATQSGLPEGASSSTLTYQPPAGALLLSPFAKAGAKPTRAFDPTSPRKSLQKLLRG